MGPIYIHELKNTKFLAQPQNIVICYILLPFWLKQQLQDSVHLGVRILPFLSAAVGACRGVGLQRSPVACVDFLLSSAHLVCKRDFIGKLW